MQKLIPPFVVIISILAMVLIHFIAPFQIVVQNPFNFLGVILIISGLTITKKVRKMFSKIDTEIHTFKKPSQFVTYGLFQYSRNPIYLGFVIVLIGVNITLGSLTPFVFVLIFIFVTNYWYIPFEEKNMQIQFGKDYENYKKKVRRWI